MRTCEPKTKSLSEGSRSGFDMAEERRGHATAEDLLHERLEVLEDTQRATLNILEDFDEEKGKLEQVQRAAMNLLEDFDEERRKFQLIQTATLNLLDDVNEERIKSDETKRALMNMLEDIEVERGKAELAKTQLQAVNKELEAFSYSVSHDLRAPLRAISGFVGVLQQNYAPVLDDNGKKYMGYIRENAEIMGSLIDDLLAFSRLSRQPMATGEIDMNNLAQSVFDEVGKPEADRQIHFAAIQVPIARGDRSLLRQVMVNLISNAIKFTRQKKDALIEFGFDADQSAYYVRDNGVGFDMKYVGKLFGVFQRLHPVEEFEGTGVGLALVHRIITRHGGRVWALGEVGRGATFFFTLPS